MSADAWKTMTDAKKKKYEALHQKDIQRYQNQWNQLETKGFFVDQNGVKSTDMVARRFKYPEGTKFPPQTKSAFRFYL